MAEYRLGLGGYRLLQTANQSPSQMMGYILDCPDGSVIVIDGGTHAETPRLRALLRQRGGRVALWLLTHCHSDHVTAPIDILERPGDIAVETLCYNFPESDWMKGTGEAEEFNAVSGRYRKAALPPVVKAEQGLTQMCGGVEIECMNDPLCIVREPEADPPGFHVNDSSAVFKFTFPNGKVILFPGDLGPGLSQRLADELGDRLRADACEMAHHGQNGACEAFYEAVRPSLCMWDAPRWLWENDAGEGYATGPWKTVEVRDWMAKLGVLRHAVIADGENTIL